jgi:hypothetical protein
MEGRQISIVFVREYRSFVAQFSKKSKEDYVLNVNKIIKEKFKTKFIVPNKVQSFLLNYEIKKLLDKAINIKNKKYKRIIYLNSNLSAIAVEKTIDFIESEYSEFGFAYILIESKSSEEEIQEVVGVTTIRV